MRTSGIARRAPCAVPRSRVVNRPADRHPVLDLQAIAGNHAVTQLVQRRVVMPPGGPVSDIQFTVGQEISKVLAQQAKAAAAGGITSAEVGALRTTALGDGTVTDDERMFLAGLLDGPNAAATATMAVTPGSAVTFTAASIRPHLAGIRDLGRVAPDAEVVKELIAARNEYATSFNSHMRVAQAAAIKQIHRLIPSGPWRAKVDILIDHATMWTGEVLKAMLAGASDSTPGDMVLAGVVYLVASQANHPLAGDLQAGRIKIDQLPGNPPPGQFASYSAFGTGADKGDTIYVYSNLDLRNLAHRRAIIHELEHGLDDKSTTAGHFRPSQRDDAEVRAYRAGSRYTLERLHRLSDDARWSARNGDATERRRTARAYQTAVADLAGQAHPIHLVGLALEAHRDLTRFQMLVIDVNSAFPAPKRAPSGVITALLNNSDAVVETELRQRIQQEIGVLDASGNLDPAKNLGRFDALSGESVLDTVDLPKQ